MGQIPRSTVLVDYKVWSLLREQVNKVKSQQYRWATPAYPDWLGWIWPGYYWQGDQVVAQPPMSLRRGQRCPLWAQT